MEKLAAAKYVGGACGKRLAVCRVPTCLSMSGIPTNLFDTTSTENLAPHPSDSSTGRGGGVGIRVGEGKGRADVSRGRSAFVRACRTKQSGIPSNGCTISASPRFIAQMHKHLTGLHDGGFQCRSDLTLQHAARDRCRRSLSVGCPRLFARGPFGIRARVSDARKLDLHARGKQR